MGATFAPKTMAAFLVLGVVNLLVPAAFGADPVSVLSILKASKDAIESYDVQRNMEIVHKHYFTTTKEYNVFYHSIKETASDFNEKFPLNQLLSIERILLKTMNQLSFCVELPDGVNKAQCFYHLSAPITELEEEVRWEVVPNFQLYHDKAKLGTLYEAVAALNAHLSLIATHHFKFFNNKRVAERRRKPFAHLLARSDFIIRNYLPSMETWLTDSVSPATICKMTETFWKSFEHECETRWISTISPREGACGRKWRNELRRSLYNNRTLNVDTPFEKRQQQKVVVVPESPERMEDEADQSFENDYLNLEEQRSISDILEKFGGNKGTKTIKYRVQVKDQNNGEVFFEKIMNADIGSRGDVMNTLAQLGLTARTQRMEQLKHKLDRVNELTHFTARILEEVQKRM